MEELSVDSSLAPDLVQFFNTKLKDARQALDKSQREIQDLQDEIAQLRQQKMDAFAMDVDDDANAAPDSEIEQELQRTRHALAGSNREVLELAHANLLLEEESARLRVQLGTQPLVHIEEHVKPLASCLDRFRAEEDIAKQLQELRANENRYEKKLQYVRKKLASLKEHAAEGSNMIYERDGPEISVKSMLNLPLSPLASDQDSGGEGEEENPDGENEPTRRVRFRDDGQIHETCIPCMGHGRNPDNLPQHIKEIFNESKFIYAPGLTIYPFNHRHECVRILGPVSICNTAQPSFSWKPSNTKLSRISDGYTLELFNCQHDGSSNTCYLGTFRCTATGLLPMQDYRLLSKGTRVAILQNTFPPGHSASSPDWDHVRSMYLAGIRQIHYADFERVSFNYMLYDALIKQKERDDASTNGKERDSAMEAPRRRRKRKRDSGNRQANKRAYI